MDIKQLMTCMQFHWYNTNILYKRFRQLSHVMSLNMTNAKVLQFYKYAI